MATRLNQRTKPLLILLSGGLSFGAVALAQDTGSQQAGPQGTVLTFTLGERLQYSDNLDLGPVSLGSTTEAITDLDFSLTRNTDTSTLAITAGLEVLLAKQPPGGSAVDGLNNPFLGLTYKQFTASTVLDFNALLSRTNLSQTRIVTDFDTGSGIRGNSVIGAAINWGQDAPFGYGLSAAYEDIDYIDTSDPGLIDARRLDFGANASFALSATTQLTLGLDQSNFSEPGAADELTTGGSAGLVLKRASGDVVTLKFFREDTAAGQRDGLSLRYSRALPNGSLVFTPGLTRATTGKVYWTSDFLWEQNLPTGRFSAAWSQEVTAQNVNNEEVVLRDVLLNYAYDLDDRNSLQFNLGWGQQIFTADDSTDTNTSFKAAWNRSLTEDWNLDVGYLYNIRDGRTTDSAQSNTVYLQLNRNFSTRY